MIGCTPAGVGTGVQGNERAGAARSVAQHALLSWGEARIAADTRRQEGPMKTYAIARLDEIDALADGRYRYRPVRHHLASRASV
jgi:hypothetical protein